MTYDVLVIGGGPQGLAVLAALAARPEAWPARVGVVDPHEGWATAWDEKLARLALDRLRSPQVHHPGPQPMALRDLVEALPDADQLTLRRPEAERVPTPAGMRAYIDTLAEGLGPVEWIVGRAASVDQRSAGRDGDATVTLDDDRTLDAHRVVLAHNPSTPRLPEWAGPLLAAGRAVHASRVDLRLEPVEGRRIAIVGGGLTAGSLAVEAVRGGAQVTLLTRRLLRARPYDVDASWLGPRRLEDYRSADAAGRRALIDVARDGGTMPQRVLDELRRLAADADPALVIREAVDVELALLEAVDVERVTREADEGDAADGASSPSAFDAIWLATGFANDAAADPLVAPLLDAHAIPLHDGLPEVTDDVALPGTRIHVVGPYAALAVGPASRNLAGARPAAARIAAALAR